MYFGLGMDGTGEGVAIPEDVMSSGPSNSYGCARTGGVAVGPRHQPKHMKTKQHQGKPVTESKGVHCEPRNGLCNSQSEFGHQHIPTEVKRNTVKKPVVKEDQQKAVKKAKGHYSCKECGDVFSFRCNLLRHEERHFASARDHRCDQCGKTFAIKRNLARHAKLHAPLDPKHRPYACDQCHKSFLRAKSLYHHKNVHDNLRQFPCQFCKKTFKTSFNRERHEDIHLNCKPYACRFCGVAFIRSSYRTIHERIHTKERPFKCDTCDKSFVRGDHLKNHRKVHGKK